MSFIVEHWAVIASALLALSEVLAIFKVFQSGILAGVLSAVQSLLGKKPAA